MTHVFAYAPHIETYQDMKNTYIYIIVLLLCLTGLQAQPVITPDIPSVKGYQVKVKTTQPYKTLYLTGHYGSQRYILDSVAVRKGKATFKSKAATPCGVYIVTPNKPEQITSHVLRNNDMDIILNKDNKFVLNMQDLTMEVSEENRLMHDIIYKTPSEEQSLRSREVKETAPQAFVSKYLMAAYGAKTEPGMSYPNLMRQYASVTDLTEPRLLCAPTPLFTHLEYTLTSDDFQYTDTLIRFMDFLLERPAAPAVRNYLISTTFQTLDVHNPDYDPVLIHLYDKYDHSWIEEGREGRYKRKIDNLRKIVPGAQIPELISHDKDGKAHSTNEIKNKYTVLWFWDPDCDHCQEMTPVLHKMYQENADKWDFEVFAVEVNDDHDRWMAFSNQHQLWDWTNLSTSMGDQNLDFIEYFDIMTTPVIFLIDNSNKHTIIARQITLNELEHFFETNQEKK